MFPYVYFFHGVNLTLPEIAVFCGMLEANGLHIVYKNLRRIGENGKIHRNNWEMC